MLESLEDLKYALALRKNTASVCLQKEPLGFL
jgi:hypothetical protein